MKKRIIVATVFICFLLSSAMMFGGEETSSNSVKGNGNFYTQAGTRCGNNFVDADGDGICDNYGNQNCRRGNGKCARWGKRDGQGPNYRGGGNRGAGFVDKDKDGICDNYRGKTVEK